MNHCASHCYLNQSAILKDLNDQANRQSALIEKLENENSELAKLYVEAGERASEFAKKFDSLYRGTVYNAKTGGSTARITPEKKKKRERLELVPTHG